MDTSPTISREYLRNLMHQDFNRFITEYDDFLQLFDPAATQQAEAGSAKEVILQETPNSSEEISSDGITQETINSMRENLAKMEAERDL